MFQCSSASRKIGNLIGMPLRVTTRLCFSALLRAEKSEILEVVPLSNSNQRFSALLRAEKSEIRGEGNS